MLEKGLEAQATGGTKGSRVARKPITAKKKNLTGNE
jgi:hypothetical protein